MNSDLDLLFRPRRVAVVGAGPNDPTRMGSRTLYDLVSCDWKGEIYPVSSKYQELYGLSVYRTLRDIPQSPDVVLARTPSAGIEALVEDAIAAGARFLIVLAAGFAESGADGAIAQGKLLARAASGGLRIVGPQSIGLVNCIDGLPLSLSQIMERLVPGRGRTAILSQSGAMAISLAMRGQIDQGLSFSYLATFGNSADVTPVEALQWLASDPHTDVIGMYMEGFTDGKSFAEAVQSCKGAGKSVVILRSGLSKRGAQAVASHTASMSGDADAFRAACRQLGVALCESSESFLWALKAVSGRRLDKHPAVAFASISGGACALWADHAERLKLDLPSLAAEQREKLSQRLPAFLAPSNPMDLGPAVFDVSAFEATLQSLLDQPSFSLLVIYLFTSSPSLMGGLDKIRVLESVARRTAKPVWVIWEAPTSDEWAALLESEQLVAFRDLGQAAAALAAVEPCGRVAHFEWPAGSARGTQVPASGTRTSLTTEPEVKEWLRGWGLSIPTGKVCADGASAQEFASARDRGVVLKIVSPNIHHKSDVGGVVFCPRPARDVAERRDAMLKDVRSRVPSAQAAAVLVEELISDYGLELFASVRRDAVYGVVTVIGRGGVHIEVDRDYVVHVGLLSEAEVPELLRGLRCEPLLNGFRGAPALARDQLARTLVRLQAAFLASDLSSVELNPLKLTVEAAWVLDALSTSRSTTA